MYVLLRYQCAILKGNDMPNTYVYNVFTAPKAGEAVDLIPDRVTFDAATGKATYEEGLANGRFAAPKNLDVQKDGTVYTLSGFVPDINQDGVADNTAADGIYITTMKTCLFLLLQVLLQGLG